MEATRLSRQLGACWPWALAILGSAALIFAAAFFVQWLEGVPLGDLTRDPTTVAGVPLYVGFISQLGIFTWAASATACVMAALVGAQDLHWRRFFLYAAGLSLMLGFDDIFLLHEVFFPYFGVPELVVFAVYAVLVAAFLLRHFHRLVQTQYLLLGMAFGFLGASVLADLLNVQWVEPYFVEDALKLVGVLSWLCYFGRTATAALVPAGSRRDGVRPEAARVPPFGSRRERQTPPEAVAGQPDKTVLKG